MKSDIQRCTNDRTIALAYSSGEILPLRSRTRASLSFECSPCERMIAHCRMKYAIAAISKLTPYSAVGKEPDWFSPILAVTNGSSERQNSKGRLDHMLLPIKQTSK